MNSKTTVLDVREDFRSGQHPCDKIHAAIKGVRQGETLRLLVPFEPVPLFALAAKAGLAHQAGKAPEGHWEVLFHHDPAAAAQVRNQKGNDTCSCSGPPSDEIIEVDARGLEPPQPMVKILGALAQLPQGASLRARTNRRPVHLYAHLEDRGFIGESRELEDGSFITDIRRS